jgi:hypothetical protein
MGYRHRNPTSREGGDYTGNQHEEIEEIYSDKVRAALGRRGVCEEIGVAT